MSASRGKSCFFLQFRRRLALVLLDGLPRNLISVSPTSQLTIKTKHRHFSASFQMEHTRSWYIPRPSLSSNSSSSTSKSHDSIRRYHRDSEVIDIDRPKAKRNSTKNATASSSSSSLSSHHRHPKNQMQTETCVDGDCDSPKRGSRSSQGSSDSEQSIHVRFISEQKKSLFFLKKMEKSLPLF